jgi:Uma2 family endonuclease
MLAEPAGVSTAPLSDDVLYEIIDGRYVELPPMSLLANLLATVLTEFIASYVRSQQAGRVATETLFDLAPLVPRRRRPDVAYVSFARWAKDRPIPEEGNAWEVAPDLAIECVSPTDLGEELIEKLEDYYQAGVRLVWVVYPRRRCVYVYESLTQIKVLGLGDELDGGSVLPGFRLPLATLFEEVIRHNP